MQSYTMQDASSVADQAAQAVTAYLQRLPETAEIENVEDIAAYRAIDVDLLWRLKDGRTVLIEVKGDRYHRTGNFFFETISNKTRQTPGCFLYTEAHYVYYYFVDAHELHILPMPRVRDWFCEHLEEFAERETSTPTRGGDVYITVGRLVPRRIVHKHFPEVHGVQCKENAT